MPEEMTDEEVLAELPDWAQHAYKDSVPELPDGDPGDQTTWTLCRLLAEARRCLRTLLEAVDDHKGDLADAYEHPYYRKLCRAQDKAEALLEGHHADED